MDDDGLLADQRAYYEARAPEYDEWWQRSVAAYPPYAEYQTKTTRKIPLFVLDPIN